MKIQAVVAGGLLGAVFVCGTAAAQEKSQPPVPPPADVQNPVAPAQPATTPSQASVPVGTQQQPDMVTPAPVVVAPPPTSTTTLTSAEPTAPVMAKPKSCGLVNHDCKGPHFTLAIDGGASSFNESGPFGFNSGTGTVTRGGPSWGFRAGAEVLRWLAVDAHYMGMSNQANGQGGNVGLLTSGFTGEARFTAPLPYVHPYLYTGAGVYTTSVTGTDTNKAASPLNGSTEFGVPIGVGIDVPIVDGISAGAELTYHRFFGESFAPSDAIGGGDLTTGNAVIRARL